MMGTSVKPLDEYEPSRAWGLAQEAVCRVEPGFDFFRAEEVFNDVVRLFRGTHLGYRKIRAPYHDLTHTLDVFACAIRLIHGARVAGFALTDEDIAREPEMAKSAGYV